VEGEHRIPEQEHPKADAFAARPPVDLIDVCSRALDDGFRHD
jgi:hypothetical protein